MCTSMTYRCLRINVPEPSSLSFPPVPCLRKWHHHLPRSFTEHYPRLLLTLYMNQQPSPVEFHHPDIPCLSVISLPSIAMDTILVQDLVTSHFHYWNFLLVISFSLVFPPPSILPPDDCQSNLDKMEIWTSYSHQKPFGVQVKSKHLSI